MKSGHVSKAMTFFLFVAAVSMLFMATKPIETKAAENEFDMDFCEHQNISDEVEFYAATITQDGSFERYCLDCDEIFMEVIPKVNNFNLSTYYYVYNGKSKAPTVTVKDRVGNELLKNIDYKVQYASGRTKIGKYVIKVTGLDKYKFTKMLYFYVLPGQTSNITTAVNSSAVALKWNAVPGATGYRVFILQNGAWKALKDTTGNSYKVTNLKSNTKYKFAVRAFSKVGDSVLWSKTYTTVFATTKKSVGIQLSRNTATILTGKSFTIKATTYPTNVKLYWKSSDASVAKVDATGKVSGLKKGTATITAYFKYKDAIYKDTCKIKVQLDPVTININKIKNYIVKNGYINNNGNKVFSLYDEDGYKTFHWGIEYNQKEKKIHFIYLYEEEIKNATNIWFDFGIDEHTKMTTVEAEIVSYDVYGEVDSFVKATAQLNIKSFTQNSKLQFSFSTDSFGNLYRKEIKGLISDMFSSNFKFWEIILKTIDNLSFKDIGFTSYTAE